jgi:acyl carrier protein
MTVEQIEQLRDVFRTIFNIPDLEIEDDLTAKKVPGWDSFNHINLMMLIEAEFNIRFTSAEIVSLKNVGELKALMDNKLN